MSVVGRYGVGIYQTGENEFRIDNGRNYPNPRRVIVARGGHGSDANGVSPELSGYYFEPFRPLVEAGYVIYSASCGGGVAWWNNAAITALTAAVAKAKTDYGCNKVGLFGASMGGATMIQGLKTLSASVCGTAVLSAASDLDFLHNTSGYTPAYDTTPSGGMPTGYVTEMETAYATNAAGWAAATAGHKIRDEYSTWNGKGPIRCWHGTLDATVPIGQVQAFVTGVNDPNVTLRSLPGAGHIPPIPLVLGPDPNEYLQFFNALTWS